MKKLKSKLFFIQAVLLFVCLLFIVFNISWHLVEPNVYNFMMKRFVATTSGSEDVVEIIIDDKSMALHRLPWPRMYYGKILNFLNEYSKTKVIGFDGIITSPDVTNPKSDEYFYDAVKNCDNLVVGFTPLLALPESQNDRDYLKSFSNKYHINATTDVALISYGLLDFPSLSRYPENYFKAVKYVGSVYVTQHVDAPITEMYQIVNVAGKYYPSLGLRMYMRLHNSDLIELYVDKIIIKNTNLTIPAYQDLHGFQSKISYYTVNPHTGYSHKKYSAIDIIKSYDAIQSGKKPEIDPKEFDGKFVFIGANAKAAATGLADVHQTPIVSNHPGVDIQATNLDNLIHNDFLRATGFLQDFATIVGMVILTLLIIGKCPFFISIALLLILSGGYFGASIYAFSHGVAVTVITPILVQLLTTLFGYSYRFLQEGRNKEKIKRAMGIYLSPDIMKKVVQNIDDIKLGGKRANVTVLFADIRGFTSMSEKMTAEEVSKILNEYFTEIEPIITKHNGVINKFIGDAVMAIFGEPIQDVNHPVNAVRCAYEMLILVDKLQDKWITEGKPKIEIGIGINTGEAFVGNIGSEKRLEYTVIGDTVNLASRIESYNKVYKTNFLISSSTYSYVSSIVDVLKISEVQIRGKAKKMDIYEVLRLN